MKTRIAEIVRDVLLEKLPKDAFCPEISIEIPKIIDHGDFSSNVAFQLTKSLKKSPFQIAESLIDDLKKHKQSKALFSTISAARNGFINFTLSLDFLQKNIKTIRKQDKKYGMSNLGMGKKVLIEFVSANPTGPLHIGHGRWAVIGDDIASLFEYCGFKVQREFYVNDVGNQINKLEESVKAVAQNKAIPNDGYGGAYIKDIAKELKNKISETDFRNILLNDILAHQKETMQKLGVSFDNYFSEKKLHDEEVIEQVISKLTAEGHTFREGGALWFKSEALGDDKNRVLVRANGETTYFAADIAYHLNKYERGFDVLINVWGADHHGYVPRLKAAIEALELPAGRFEVIIGQLVSLYRGSEPVKMSKRTGDMVTLEEVVSEIGSDATRFFLTMNSANNHVNFDLELAKQKSQDNPVYYVQYAHARICSILRKSKIQISKSKENPKSQNLTSLNHEAERILMRKLLDVEDEVIAACRKREPHQIVNYMRDLAQIFHNFYHKCRVLENPSRLMLVDATRIVFRNMLELLKITAPEKM
ncbi:MAG: arginine--tRNA ligase [Candidatus Saganbacteria bacterium]|nr:arginine--tRNA ligase [Candidatus Saganbacteria bacterium]